MSDVLKNIRISQRTDTLENWTYHNPILKKGELAIVDCGDKYLVKIGDGTSNFSELKYLHQDSLSSETIYAKTININSENGLSGLYIGENNLGQVLNNYSRTLVRVWSKN